MPPPIHSLSAPISISFSSRSHTDLCIDHSASIYMAKSLIFLCAALAACFALAAADWSQGTATFYGGPDGSGTMDN